MYYFAVEYRGHILANNEFLTYYRYHNSVSNAIGNLEYKINKRFELFINYISTLKTLSPEFKSKKVKRDIFNFLLALEIDHNILCSINGIDNKKIHISIIDIIKFIFIFNYWNSYKYYLIKYIKLIQMYLPIKLKKMIEYHSLSK